MEHIEANEIELEHSVEKQALEEISSKQNVRKGLTNVSDECSHFCQILDKKVRLFQSTSNLDVYGTSFSSIMYSNINNDIQITSTWKQLFTSFENNELEMVSQTCDSILQQVIHKYCRMSISQLRKEYLQSKKTKKLEAHRKQIKMRNTNQKLKAFTMTQIIQDKSVNKLSSHRRIQSELINNDMFLENSFTKKQLQMLCSAYNVQKYKSLTTKKAITSVLKPMIMNCNDIYNLSVLCSNEMNPIQECSSEVTCSSGIQTGEKTKGSDINCNVMSSNEINPFQECSSEEPCFSGIQVGGKRKSLIKGKGKGKKSKRDM